MLRNILLSLTLGMSALLCSCSADYEITREDHLTPAEEDAVTAHVRRFVSKARKLNITEEERALIQTGKPDFHVRYTGYKEAHLTVRWNLPNYRVLMLQRSGKLLSGSRADWTIRLITDQASGKIPKNFYGANGEDISLPPR